MIRRTMLNAGSQTLGEEGKEGDDGYNGELHDVYCLVVEICRCERISKVYLSGLNRAPKSTQYLYDPVR